MGSKLNPIFTFPKFCQHSKLCSSKTSGGVTTSLESAIFLLSYNASPSFIARYILELQLLKVPSSSSCLPWSRFSSHLLQSYDTPALQIHRNSSVPSQLSTNLGRLLGLSQLFAHNIREVSKTFKGRLLCGVCLFSSLPCFFYHTAPSLHCNNKTTQRYFTPPACSNINTGPRTQGRGSKDPRIRGLGTQGLSCVALSFFLRLNTTSVNLLSSNCMTMVQGTGSSCPGSSVYSLPQHADSQLTVTVCTI